MTETLREISSCEVCGGADLISVLDLGTHPMCDDLVPIGDARTCREYPIEILFCRVCRTAHQRFQVPKRELFPTTYHYRSRFTADVLRGMEQLVESCRERFGALEERRVLDIGCNDGSLLDFFHARGARTFGIEPTGASADATAKGHTVYPEFLSEDLAAQFVASHGRPDFITFTNVFAHIENLREVLRALKRLMSDRTVVVIENHYLGAVLERMQFDTFYHEHPRTYSATSFGPMATTLGVALLGIEFPARYGGNIRVFMGAGNSAEVPGLEQREAGFLAEFGALRHSMEQWRESKAELISELVRQHGKLRAKAFPGRAAILVKLLGLDERSISAVYEKPGSMKIGHYLPGTRVPIRSDDELFAVSESDAPLLNLAWHIPQEIRGYLEEHGYRGPVIDIVG